jgi:hypothetical protein
MRRPVGTLVRLGTIRDGLLRPVALTFEGCFALSGSATAVECRKGDCLFCMQKGPGRGFGWQHAGIGRPQNRTSLAEWLIELHAWHSNCVTFRLGPAQRMQRRILICRRKRSLVNFVAAGVLLNVGIGPAWAADPAGSCASAANRLPAQIAQAATDQPPPPAGEQPAAAGEQPAAPTAMTTPTMVGPLAANPNPISFDAGPLGPVYMTGVVSALGLWQWTR